MLIDTHCHLTHERFQEDLPEVLTRAGAAGVGIVVAVASDLNDAETVRRLWADFPDEDRGPNEEPRRPTLRGTAGIHPHVAGKDRCTREDLLDAVSCDRRVVALGECGLDYHYDFSPRQAQRRVMDLHVEVGAETGLPLVVHCREAEQDMREVVRGAADAGVRGVLHCFPGDLDLLEIALDAEWLVSFTGIVTFNSFEGTEAVRRVPSDRYMIETDGPYLAPVPHRGRRNEPELVSHVRDRVAELREEDVETVERDTTSTARSFFGI